MKKPNVIFVFSDQHRLQDVGYVGNKQVQTPFLDKLQRESCEFTQAISGCPVCCPYRATLMTGRYPLSHGVFVNDVFMDCGGAYLGEIFKENGYETAYIGKWHIDGHGRESYIPPERRRGFDFWRTNECTHDYNHSVYYADEDETPRFWEGYDAFAQTDCAAEYIRNYSSDKPMLLVLSYGPPHNPYQTAPEQFRTLYRAEDIRLRPNVPAEEADIAKEELAGYYAHISALDCAVKQLHDTVVSQGMEENTIFIYTSDHGDMLHSHGLVRKQKPWEESVRVPFLMKYPALFGKKHTVNDKLFNSVDILPTLCGLCGIPVPESAEGKDFAPWLRGEDPDFVSDAVLLECDHPFGEYARRPDKKPLENGREYRGVRTDRYTYVADRNGAWLLYDNREDPYQLHNLVDCDEYKEIRDTLDKKLRKMLAERGDTFENGMEYIRRFAYPVDPWGTVPY